jgi:flagellar biosynthesis anti-sigma factor FlgM
MRIDNSPSTTTAGISVTTAPAARAADRGTAGKSPGAAGGGGDDEVQLSGLAGSLDRLRSDSAQRVAEVEQLTKVVAAGQYSPDPAAIARGLVDEALGA